MPLQALPPRSSDAFVGATLLQVHGYQGIPGDPATWNASDYSTDVLSDQVNAFITEAGQGALNTAAHLAMMLCGLTDGRIAMI